MNENTLNVIKLQATQGAVFDATKAIFEESFPLNERRPIDSVYHVLRYEDRFSCYVMSASTRVTKDMVVIGFISEWEFDDFIYIEYLAVKEELRGQGHGSILLDKLLADADKPVVLEVEHPKDELSTRRVHFYERRGFKVQPEDYVQPSYGEVPGLPMLILRYDKEESKMPTSEIIKEMRREVYRCVE